MHVDAVSVHDDQFAELPKVKGNAARQRDFLGPNCGPRNQASTTLGSFGASM